MAKQRLILSWSGGKDSAWALHKLRSDPSYEIAGLFTSINSRFDRVAMHGVRHELLRRQARAAGIPLWTASLPWPCSNEQYQECMASIFVRAAKENIGVVAFGDLFLEDIRVYREKQLEATGRIPLFPLWKLPTRALAEEMIEGGLRARLACVDPKQLDARFVGREFDRQLLRDLPSSVDPCGENGEFHTFVYDGPMFQSAIPVREGQVVERDSFIYCDLLPVANEVSTSA